MFSLGFHSLLSQARCVSNVIVYSRRSADNRLSEAEVFIGTILSTTEKPTYRQKTIAKMREKTTDLVASTLRGIKQQGLGGVEEGAKLGLEELRRWMEVIWACWLEAEARRMAGESFVSPFSPQIRQKLILVASASLLSSPTGVYGAETFGSLLEHSLTSRI